MAEAGELTGRTFTRTANLVLRFKEYGALVSERWPTRLELRMPFFYLRTQGFWQGFTLEMAPAQSPESCFVSELNEEFFDLLGDADFRLKARLLLVSRYFEPRERVWKHFGPTPRRPRLAPARPFGKSPRARPSALKLPGCWCT